jgi:uncharacterized protein (DUF1810 family)
MWFIFPQLEGLGSSPMAKYYAIKNLDEAVAYLAHPVLGTRLLECCEALLIVRKNSGFSARAILDTPDDLKLCSCATLFSKLTPVYPVFARIISQFYFDCPDSRTLELLRALG